MIVGMIDPEVLKREEERAKVAEALALWCAEQRVRGPAALLPDLIWGLPLVTAAPSEEGGAKPGGGEILGPGNRPSGSKSGSVWSHREGMTETTLRRGFMKGGSLPACQQQGMRPE